MTKNMKTRISILFALLAAFGAAGCSDYLDLTPTDRITDKSVWEKETYTDLYINNFYEYLNVYGPFGEGQFEGNLTEGLTDTFKYGSPQQGARAGDCNRYVFSPEVMSAAGCLLDCWEDTYTRIRRINEFLAAMQTYSTYPAEVNTRYEAQARFFRAFLYFQLAKRYNGQAILYSSLDQIVRDAELASAEDTWQFIYDDLMFAAQNLPDEWNSANKGRLVPAAAYAMLSRVMLYAERWDDAKTAAEEVFKIGKYELAGKYADAWKGGNKESILEFNYLVTGPNHYWDRYMSMHWEYPSGSASTPTQEMVEEYEAADGSTIDWTPWHTTAGTTEYPPYEQLEPRFAATILYNGATWNEKTLENCIVVQRKKRDEETGELYDKEEARPCVGTYIDYGMDPYPYGKTVTGYYLRKLRQESLTDLSNVASSSTWVEIRLAEVYLNHAEACYRAGLPGDAVQSLKKVRDRVGLPTDTSLAGDALFAAIRHERKVELSYEGHLWWDMRRWRLAQEAYTGYRTHGMRIEPIDIYVNGYKKGNYTFTYVDCDGQDRKFLSRMYSLPIPSLELQNNSSIRQFDEWNF